MFNSFNDLFIFLRNSKCIQEWNKWLFVTNHSFDRFIKIQWLIQDWNKLTGASHLNQTQLICSKSVINFQINKALSLVFEFNQFVQQQNRLHWFSKEQNKLPFFKNE